jgi:hypothetical protein
VGQQPRDLTPNASAGHLFGAELRLWRERRGLSLARLCERFERAGRRLNAGYLAKVEQGERLPEYRQFAEVADRELQAGGVLCRLWDFADAERHQAKQAAKRERSALLDVAKGTLAPIMSGDEVFVPYVTVAGTVSYVRVTRRTFLATGGMASAAFAAGAFDPDDLDRLTWALEHPQRSDTKIANFFARMLDVHRAHNSIVDPAPRIGPVAHQVGVLDRLSRDARDPARSALRSVQAEYAAQAGWLHEQVGNAASSVVWTEKAAAWAQAAGNYQVVTFTVIRRSSMAFCYGRCDESAELAGAALASPWPVPPGLGSLAAQHAARCHAARGNIDACQASLDHAATLLSAREASGEDDVYWARMHRQDHFDALRAECYIDLGRTTEARALLDSYYTGSVLNGRGGVGEMTLRALAHGKDGDPVAACSAAEQTLQLLETPLSPARSRYLDEIDRQLEPWAGEACVQHFRRSLAAKRTAPVRAGGRAT